MRTLYLDLRVLSPLDLAGNFFLDLSVSAMLLFCLAKDKRFVAVLIVT